MSFLLGLDIGVSSVGYGIINENGDVITAGIRIFPQNDAKNNAVRRDYRHSRRTLRRREHRLLRGDRLFVRSGLASWEDSGEKKHLNLQCPAGVTPYHLRVKGLSKPLTNKELVIALRHLLKRRGVADFSIELSEAATDNDVLLTKKILNNTRTELDSGRFICEIQLERLMKNQFEPVRGKENVFFTRDYVKEAEALLCKQASYNPLITEEFKEEYLLILTSRRKYFEGPGEGSTFGWEGDIEKWMNSLIGHCTYFPEELRLPKAAPTAEFFNLLNDLNNLSMNNRHLTIEEKTLLIDELFKKQKSSPSLKKIASVLGLPKETQFSGYRVDTKEKAIFTTLKGYQFISTANAVTGKTINIDDFELLDNIAFYLSVYQSPDVASILVEKLSLTPEFADALALVYKSSANPFKGRSRLSKKAILMIWDDLWNTSKNQMVLFAEKGIKPHYGNLISSNGHINPVISEKLAVSPVVKRAVSQTFSVFNELVDSYGDFDYVTIELAREQNEIEQKAFYRKMQKNNESLHQLVADTIGLKHQGGLFTKVKLYYLQDGKDLYTGLPIDLDHLIANPFAYAINHIIPLSISFDDSLSNKVLTTAEISSEKGQRTPYQYLSEAEFEKMQRYIYQIKDAAVGENSNTVPKMPKRKLENLLFKGDITKWDVQKGFIHRNLVDTRYASREVSLAIKECFASVEKSTKVYTVNGSWTYYLRKKWGIEKDRDKDFSYRAMDALVIASSPLVFSTLKTIKLYDSFDMGFVVNHETGEVINMEELEIDLKNNLEQFAKLGHNFERYQDIKYSHKVDKKANRGLFNDTLYSTRYLTKVVAATKRKSEHKETTEWKVSFLTDLYDPKADLKKLELLFCKEPERLLIYQHDRLTFAKLKEVYSNPDYQKDEAGKKANPFTIFHLKTGKYVTKYAKHNDGPPIKRLKYLSEAINGYRLDLSEKQGCKRNKRVIVENTPTYRIDVFYDGEFYKFLVVRYHMLSSKNHKIIQHLYEEERNRRAISEEFIFQFSLYSNDLFELNGKIYRFAGVQARNCIVAKSIDTNDKYTPSIGKKTKSLNKVTSSVLGKAF